MIDYVYDDGGRSTYFKGRNTGDCVVRAIAIVSGCNYKAAYDAMSEAMKANGYAKSGNAYITNRRKSSKQRGQADSRKVQEMVLRQCGFSKVALPSGPKPTYTEAYELCGDCIVSTTKHLAALFEGMLRDTFDGRISEYMGVSTPRKAMSIWVVDPFA